MKLIGKALLAIGSALGVWVLLNLEIAHPLDFAWVLTIILVGAWFLHYPDREDIE